MTTLLVIVMLADLGVLGGLVRWIHEIPYADKVAHFGFAVGLGAVLEAALGRGGRALLVAAPLVLLEELSQLVVPGRTFDLGDLAADFVGLAIGTWAVLAHTRHACAREESRCSEREPCGTSLSP